MSKDQDKLRAMIARAEGAVKIRPIIDCEDIEEMFPWPPHSGQLEAWLEVKRIILILAGAQSGKTCAGARMLLREIQRTAVPGEPNDYLIVGPNTELLTKKAIPEFKSLTCNDNSPKTDLAIHARQRRVIEFTPEGSKGLTGQVCEITVYIGYATKPDSLESATYKGIWADECGQEDFKGESWEALKRRAAVHQARIFLTTTPYTVKGWLKRVSDKEKDDTSVIRFSSIANPAFPKSEFEDMRAEMPPWRFKMFCLGEWSKPAGAIYDCFDKDEGGMAGKTNVCVPFTIPKGWARHTGHDFGEVNMAAVFIAEGPDGWLYVYGTYRAGSRTVKEHTKAISKKGLSLHRDKNEDELAFTHSIGGTWTGDDPEFCREFIHCGFPIHRPPIRGVEVGIARVYRQFKTRRLKIFSTCTELIAEANEYSRKVNEHGEPLSEIQDKEVYHLLDALRYIISHLRPSADFEVEDSSRVEMDGTEPVGAIDGSLRTIV